ncbi:hypothetical protein Ccar_11435 [Clostridium carboxidivorans P7]|uniref:Uncharacterized protein n=1 Tax=Clostridium carboxidivorans P7 TaxID=536227 RepID=C6PTU1_9CLOT|nr:hypothetical protein [Clostridium carboxidivorans]AKN31437.1 hypothetical protein Ccar_11435 [Clostridium carboxidivorans P7]EET87331.1 hypothetical protein CcarbDRAFT_2208 [Clostridium carboxidivorans P7]
MSNLQSVNLFEILITIFLALTGIVSGMVTKVFTREYGVLYQKVDYLLPYFKHYTFLYYDTKKCLLDSDKSILYNNRTIKKY